MRISESNCSLLTDIELNQDMQHLLVNMICKVLEQNSTRDSKSNIP